MQSMPRNQPVQEHNHLKGSILRLPRLIGRAHKHFAIFGVLRLGRMALNNYIASRLSHFTSTMIVDMQVMILLHTLLDLAQKGLQAASATRAANGCG